MPYRSSMLIERTSIPIHEKSITHRSIKPSVDKPFVPRFPPPGFFLAAAITAGLPDAFWEPYMIIMIEKYV
jgi:hypothetical protein